MKQNNNKVKKDLPDFLDLKGVLSSVAIKNKTIDEV